jgi:hypothetical protein
LSSPIKQALYGLFGHSTVVQYHRSHPRQHPIRHAHEYTIQNGVLQPAVSGWVTRYDVLQSILGLPEDFTGPWSDNERDNLILLAACAIKYHFCGTEREGQKRLKAVQAWSNAFHLQRQGMRSTG